MTVEIESKINDSQMILIGIGKEWEENFDAMKTDSFYSMLMGQLSENEQEARIQLSYLKCHFLKRRPNQLTLQAYHVLHKLTKDKNYFIVSVCMDDLIYASEIPSERIVTPCGGFRRLICCASEAEVESEMLSKIDRQPELIDNVMRQIDVCEGDLKKIIFPTCEKCGQILAFNQVSTLGYQEIEYLLKWKKYTKWLQGTLNHKLCIFESGVGMEYPTVIRFPFEKAAYYNQKACFIRIHSYLYQLPLELKERGIGIKSDPLDFLLHSI